MKTANLVTRGHLLDRSIDIQGNLSNANVRLLMFYQFKNGSETWEGDSL